MEETYYTVDEVAKRFKVTRAAVYKWMRSGDLPYVYIGKDRRITGTALRAFVRQGQPDEGAGMPSGDGWLALQLASA